ncbi:MAG: protein phosphatase 2C domain-containing protein [Acetatifactor sp.]|nr:protein phosphatase 2C domain-containing protein [Acetatifactor sp.]
MGVNYVVIAVLAGVILILEILKWSCQEKRREYGESNIGTCMTIGSREVQEDQLAIMNTEAGVMAVLADGSGKIYGGRIAAKTAVETFVDIFRDYNAFNNPQYFFRKAFHCANREILKAVGDENRGKASASCAMIRGGYLYYALVGNVKIGVFREETLVPVSVGHTVAVMAEKKFHEGKISRQDTITLLENRRLYSYLGKDDFRDIEFFDAPIRLMAGDIVVLMSDGVYDLLGFREVEEVLKEQGGCQEKALKIIEKVNRNTGDHKDNASVILIGA